MCIDSTAYRYQWFFNGDSIPNSDTNKITISSYGSYSVHVINHDKCIDALYSYNHFNVGVEELDMKNGLKVYPNPFNGGFTVENTLDQEADIQYLLLGMNGRELKTSTFKGSDKDFIHVNESLSDGVYLLKISVSESSIIKKVVKM